LQLKRVTTKIYPVLKKKWFVTTVVFLLSVIAGTLFLRSGNAGFSGQSSEVDWRTLGELDYLTGKAPDSLQALDGKIVKIPGFMVPLEDNQRNVAEFLLVPTPQACIHVPPPPPNQMVLIDMEKGHETDIAYGPIWVYGKLMLKSKRHFYGESSYTMEGIKIEPYR
jgi:hypothetical protein